MGVQTLVQNDMERNPIAWVLECPRCGSLVNLKYALTLAPTIGLPRLLPCFYCPCSRFQVMTLRPARVSSCQALFLVGFFFAVLLSHMTEYVLRGRKCPT